MMWWWWWYFSSGFHRNVYSLLGAPRSQPLVWAGKARPTCGTLERCRTYHWCSQPCRATHHPTRQHVFIFVLEKIWKNGRSKEAQRNIKICWKIWKPRNLREVLEGLTCQNRKASDGNWELGMAGVGCLAVDDLQVRGICDYNAVWIRRPPKSPKLQRIQAMTRRNRCLTMFNIRKLCLTVSITIRNLCLTVSITVITVPKMCSSSLQQVEVNPGDVLMAMVGAHPRHGEWIFKVGWPYYLSIHAIHRLYSHI